MHFFYFNQSNARYTLTHLSIFNVKKEQKKRNKLLKKEKINFQLIRNQCVLFIFEEIAIYYKKMQIF